jgi:hypothetical protein
MDVAAALSWIDPGNEEADSLYSCTASNVLLAAEAVVTPTNAAAPVTIRLKNCLLFNSFIFTSLLRVLGFGFTLKIGKRIKAKGKRQGGRQAVKPGSIQKGFRLFFAGFLLTLLTSKLLFFSLLPFVL